MENEKQLLLDELRHRPAVGLEEGRVWLNRFTGGKTPLPDHRSVLHHWGYLKVLEVQALAPVRKPATDCRILYFHGGGYIRGSLTSHFPVAVYLSQATGAPVYLVDYRRAPEVPFPTPIVDGLFSWQQARKHLPAARWVWAGDSAGGGLALAALQRARDLGQGLPLGTVLFSPWTDLTLSGESLVTNKATDPWISPEGLPLLVQSYILQGGLEAEHPLASPLFGNLKGLPPFLLQASRTELLLDDTVRLHERLVAAGVESTLQLWDDQFHAFQILAPALTEAREAIEKVAIFVENLVHTQQ